MNARKICLGLAVALALTAGMAVAQPEVEWERTYGGALIENGTSLVQMDDGGYLITGFSDNDPTGRAELWVIRTSENGDSLWSRTFPRLERDFGAKMTRTSDNGVAIASSIVVGNNEYLNYWLTVLNSDGDTLWTRNYGNEGFFSMEFCQGLIQTRDGGFVLVGSTVLDDSDIWLVRTNSDGEELWSKSYGGGDFEDGFSVVQTNEGGYAIVGETRSFGAGYYDAWLLKTDAEGDSLWSRTYGGAEGDACVSLTETSDGGFILAGTTNSFGAGESDSWIVRTSEDGDSLWSTTFGSANWESCRSCILTSDGGFTLAGNVNSYSYLLIRTDQNGDSLWASTFGGERDDWCEDLIQTTDGGYALLGWTESFGVQNRDFYLVKTTPDPVSVRESQVVAPFALHLAQPYPNPFNSTVTIPFSFSPINRGATGVVRMAIFDPLGRRVAELIPDRRGRLSYGEVVGGKQSVAWNATGMPAGQYIVRLESGNQQLSQRLSLVK